MAKQIILRPVDDSGDDAVAINNVFQEAMVYANPLIDLSGMWNIQSTVNICTPPHSTIIGGDFYAQDVGYLEVGLNIDLGTGTDVKSRIRLFGKKTSHINNRNIVDGIRIINAYGCTFDGFTVRHVRRYGIRNVPAYRQSVVGASFGHIFADYCGSPGISTIEPYTKYSGIATHIERQGMSGSPVQTAIISCDLSNLPLEEGDYITIGGDPKNGGKICEVISSGNGVINVYPWPGNFEGDGTWPVEGIVGGALKLEGGDTTQSNISSMVAHYCGHGLHMQSLYGLNATNVTAELVGSAVTMGGFKKAIRGCNVFGLHGERTLVDILIGGLSVKECSITGSVEEIRPESNGYHVKPFLSNGNATGHTWPV